MKTTRTALTTLATILATTPALAETAARVDHSGLLVWGFLGMCAMIVVAQAAPAILMVVGMIRGIVGKTESEVEA